MIIAGLFLGLFGRKLWVLAIFLISAFLTMAIIMLVFYTTFLKSNTADWVGWTVLGCSLLLGVILGLVMTKFQRAGAAILGAWGGFVLGLILNESVLFLVGSQWVFWLVCVGCAIVCAVVVFITYNHAIILATSLIGSYFFVRGISFYAGGFPSEFVIIKEIKNGIITTQPWSVWVYLAGIIVSTVICAVVQYKQLASMTEQERQPYERLR